MGLYPESNGKLVYAFNQGFTFTRFYFDETYLAAACREWMGDVEMSPPAKGPGDRGGTAAGLPGSLCGFGEINTTTLTIFF